LGETLHWLAGLRRGWHSHPSRQLRLSETLALGERRFVAVIEFERQKYLIAGTGNSVGMLTALPDSELANQNRMSSALSKKENAQENGNDEIPTWGFAGAGPAVEMVRR